MFGFLKKKDVNTYSDTSIVAIANGEMIPLEKVNDEVFAQKIMGDGIAFCLSDGIISSPANGYLTAVFPTGHAFGITMENGIELLVHIGINTVENKGKGMEVMVKQGQKVKAGDTLVKVNLDELKKHYDMTTMLIVTNTNGKKIMFKNPDKVTRGEVINLE